MYPSSTRRTPRNSWAADRSMAYVMAVDPAERSGTSDSARHQLVLGIWDVAVYVVDAVHDVE